MQPFAVRFADASINGGQLAAISADDQDLKDLGLTLRGQRDTFRQLLTKLQAGLFFFQVTLLIALTQNAEAPVGLLRPQYPTQALFRLVKSSAP